MRIYAAICFMGAGLAFARIFMGDANQVDLAVLTGLWAYIGFKELA